MFLIGELIGKISLLIPRKIEYPWNLFKRSVITGRYKKFFKQFGHGSLLSFGVQLYKPQYISIGERCSIANHCILEAWPISEKEPEIIIGDGVSIGEFSHITCVNKVVIGNNVLTGRFVLISDNGHGDSSIENLDVPPIKRNITSKGPIEIGNNVWIGDKVTILPNITIGENSIIAANAVVTKDVPAYTMIAGCPAKIIKKLKN